MRLKDRIVAFFDRINDVLVFVAGIILIFIVTSVSAEVIFRYFLNAPFTWVVEVNENNLLYITFLAVAAVLAKDGHVKVELVMTRLNPKAQNILELITCIIGMLICLIITWYASRLTWHDFQSGAFKPGLNKIPEASVLFIIPVGMFLLSIQFLIKICILLKKTREYQD